MSNLEKSDPLIEGLTKLIKATEHCTKCIQEETRLMGLQIASLEKRLAEWIHQDNFLT